MNILKPSKSKPSRDELASIEFEPFSELLKAIIEESLKEAQKDGRNRKGTLFTPIFTVFVVLALTMHQDLSYPKVLNWLISTVRWITVCLPKDLVENGTITKARQYLGVDVFRLIFEKFTKKYYKLTPDFHGRSTVAFDGVTGTTPDTKSNNAAFGKPSTKKGSAAFPQVRAVALMSLTMRCILGFAFGPYVGKGTGERALMLQILNKFKEKELLFLFDAGFYFFELLELFEDTQQSYIMKLSKGIKVKCIRKLPDGSFIGIIKKKFKNPDSVPGICLPKIGQEPRSTLIPYQTQG